MLNEAHAPDPKDRAWLAAPRRNIAKYQPGRGTALTRGWGTTHCPIWFASSWPLMTSVDKSTAPRPGLPGLRAWRQELEDEWQLTRGLARARNALAHGGQLLAPCPAEYAKDRFPAAHRLHAIYAGSPIRVSRASAWGASRSRSFSDARSSACSLGTRIVRTTQRSQ